MPLGSSHLLLHRTIEPNQLPWLIFPGIRHCGTPDLHQGLALMKKFP